MAKRWFVFGCALVASASACTRGAMHGTDADRAASSPRASSPDDPVAIAAGWHLSCVLRRSGDVWCWGAGEVGYTKPEQRGVPFRMPVDHAEEIAVAGMTACARTRAGKMTCATMSAQKPLFADGIAPPARSIALTSWHACAVTSDGRVRCMPFEVDDSAQEPHGADPVIAFADRVREAKLVRLGHRHACVVSVAGAVSCWGNNDDGRLGAGVRSAVDGPVVVPGLSKVVDLVMGMDHACALDAEGFVSCWGAGKSGQLGDGSTTARSSPVRVRGLENVTAIYGGLSTTCAKTREGKIMCFGEGTYGRFGDPSVSIATTPRELPWRDLEAVAIGGSHACSIARDGRLRCWGSAASGLLGDGAQRDRPEPVHVPGLSHVVEIVAGSEHTVARLDDGKLVGAGREQDLGLPTSPLGNATKFTAIGPSRRPSAGVFAGEGSTCSIEGADALCWGTVVPRSSPIGVKAPPLLVPTKLDTPPVTRIVGHADFRCALTTSGEVRCWGSNDLGQLGDGTKVSRSEPRVVPGLPVARDVAAGSYHACAIVADDELHCWGSASFAGLADGAFGAAGRATRVRGVPRARAVALGIHHTCALVPDGSVVCFGANDGGQLGNGSRAWSTSPAPISGVHDAIGISAWGAMTCAVLRDGHVVCWGGSNGFGERGVGDYEPHPMPEVVHGITNATSVSVGAFHACARLADGTASCWGLGQRGQLGDGFEEWTAAAREVRFDLASSAPSPFAR